MNVSSGGLRTFIDSEEGLESAEYALLFCLLVVAWAATKLLFDNAG